MGKNNNWERKCYYTLVMDQLIREDKKVMFVKQSFKIVDA